MPDHCSGPSYTVKFVAYGLWVAKEATKWNVVRGLREKRGVRGLWRKGSESRGEKGERATTREDGEAVGEGKYNSKNHS